MHRHAGAICSDACRCKWTPTEVLVVNLWVCVGGGNFRVSSQISNRWSVPGWDQRLLLADELREEKQTLDSNPGEAPLLIPSLCPVLVYSFFHFLLPLQIIKFTACFPGSAAFVLHSCFSFPPSSLPGLLRPTLLTPIFLLSHHIHLYSFHLSLIYNHSPSLPHFPLFLFLIMIITQLFLFLYGSMTRLPSLLPLAASFLHSSTSISFHLFDSPLPVSLLSCSAFSCFSSISCCSSIIIIQVFSSLFFISICLLIFLTFPPPPPHTLFLSNISFSGFSSCFSFSPAFALPLCLPPLGPAVLPEALCWIWGFSAAEAMKEAAFGWKLTEHARNQQTLLGCWGVENVNMLWLQSHCLSPHVGQTTCAGCPNTYALQQLLSVIIDFCSFLCSKVFSLFAKLWFMEGSEHAQSMQDLLEVAPTIFMPAQQTEAPPSF